MLPTNTVQVPIEFARDKVRCAVALGDSDIDRLTP
jgi:hypothetical protein